MKHAMLHTVDVKRHEKDEKSRIMEGIPFGFSQETENSQHDE